MDVETAIGNAILTTTQILLKSLVLSVLIMQRDIGMREVKKKVEIAPVVRALVV